MPGPGTPGRPTASAIEPAAALEPKTVTDSVQAKPRGAEPVLLLHCSASSGRQWEGLARSLDDRYRAVAPDLYGYGESGP